MLEDFLPLVTKPARYINSEINSIHKDLTNVTTRVCLLFPDTYEVGMSHLGLRILYHLLNSRKDTACERVFSPWTDYEEKLRASGRPLTSLESNLPLSAFDIIGITLQYELSYTNVLTALTLGNIPLRSSDRNESHPVVVAGGPCAVNPMPLSDFIDAFFIGEAEESLHEIVELKQTHADRGSFLRALSERDSWYVPALGRTIVRRRIVKHLDSALYPDRPILPLMKPVHDRATVEIARGCIRGCRYCQAGIIYRPYRERSKGTIESLLHESLRCTGYEELSLASLSTGDYSAIQNLMQSLLDRYGDARVSISLPSLRIGTLTPDMIQAIAGVRKTGFTLAPEAGTERLRRVINKPLSEADLMASAETIFSSGWKVLKLYFMIGLPTETDEDLDGIIALVQNLLALGKGVTKRPVQLNVSISTFVPKPHTPFQWFGQMPKEETRRKQSYLAKRLKRKGISLNRHSAETSVLEAALSRGDHALGKVIERAVQLGCRFDGWTECFDFSRWTTAFNAFGLKPEEYAERRYALDERLPWDHIRTGVTTEFLRREYRRALSSEITENCRVRCDGCGVGCNNGGVPEFGKSAREDRGQRMTDHDAVDSGAPENEKKSALHHPPARIRMKYAKTGRLCFLSHLDLITMFQRAVVRAGIPMTFTEGYNPHPRIAFGPALPVGVESVAEYLDMETGSLVDLPKATGDLNTALPQGMRILEARVIPRNTPSLSASISRYTYRAAVPDRYGSNLMDRIRIFMETPSLFVEKKGKRKDIKPFIEAIAPARGEEHPVLDITLQDRNGSKVRPVDVIEKLFAVGPGESSLFRITRTAVQAKAGGRWIDPMDTGHDRA